MIQYKCKYTNTNTNTHCRPPSPTSPSSCTSSGSHDPIQTQIHKYKYKHTLPPPSPTSPTSCTSSDGRLLFALAVLSPGALVRMNDGVKIASWFQKNYFWLVVSSEFVFMKIFLELLLPETAFSDQYWHLHFQRHSDKSMMFTMTRDILIVYKKLKI